MTILRRTMLKVLAAAPVALRQEVAPALNMGRGTLGAEVNRIADCPPTQAGITPPDYKPVWRWLHMNPEYLAELRDAINRETHVTYIDPDLLAMRSLSTAARIYYMRQRLVDRQMRIQLSDDISPASLHSLHVKWIDIARKALGVFQ